jgi:glycosyltransferase involved in cell wall biosynthesis
LGLDEERSSAIYLCLDKAEIKPEALQLHEDSLDLCYLGAINNVIGISEICDLLRKLAEAKPVTLHIIGTGERQEEFMESVKMAGAEVVYYGAVYDWEKKQKIINRCHFGLNVINSYACIGLTMKSVDYLRSGLPIISNVPGDTQQLIAEYHAGIQLDGKCAERIANMTVAENTQMRKNATQLFEGNFSTTVVREKYQRLFETLL